MTRHKIRRFLQGVGFGVAVSIPVASSMDGPYFKFIYPVASGLIGGIGWGLLRPEETGVREGRSAPWKLLIATAIGGVVAFVVLGAARTA